MANKGFVFRIEMEGGKPIIRQLDDIGDRGARAGSMVASGFGAADAAMRRATAAFAGFLSIQGVRALASHIGNAVKELDDLGDAAERLDTGVEMLTKWGMALEVAGGQQEALTASFDGFQEKVGKFMAGVAKEGGGIGKALGALGITKEQLQDAGTLERRLLLIAQALSQVGDRAARAGLADALGLTALLPLLEKGEVGVRELTGRFAELGAKAADAAAQAGPLANKMAEVEKQFDIASQTLYVKLGPALIWAMERGTELVTVLEEGMKRLGLIDFTPADNIALATKRMKDLRAELEKTAGATKDFSREGANDSFGLLSFVAEGPPRSPYNTAAAAAIKAEMAQMQAIIGWNGVLQSMRSSAGGGLTGRSPIRSAS